MVSQNKEKGDARNDLARQGENATTINPLLT